MECMGDRFVQVLHFPKTVEGVEESRSKIIEIPEIGQRCGCCLLQHVTCKLDGSFKILRASYQSIMRIQTPTQMRKISRSSSHSPPICIRFLVTLDGLLQVFRLPKEIIAGHQSRSQIREIVRKV